MVTPTVKVSNPDLVTCLLPLPCPPSFPSRLLLSQTHTNHTYFILQLLELFRSNAQFQQLNPQQQQAAIHQHSMAMGQMGHPQAPSLGVPQGPSMQVPQQNPSMPPQQLDQLLRNPSGNPNPFNMNIGSMNMMRRMAISGDNGITRQLQLLNDGSGIRAPSSALPNRGS